MGAADKDATGSENTQRVAVTAIGSGIVKNRPWPAFAQGARRGAGPDMPFVSGE